jgi:SAM-dependent methyltransferase
MNYVGVDISSAVDVASELFRRENRCGVFIQADLCHLPFADGTFDFILSEGVLHHTPSTRESLLRLAAKLKPGGKIAFYVYVKKSPIREFTDDYIRSLVAGMDPAAVWEILMPLSKLGKSLGELNVTVDVPEDVPLLGIKKGPINLQRLFYWHICKMYYRPEYNLEEMNHVNFDWFTPTYSFRQTPEEVASWCAEAGLEVLSQRVEEAGITTLAVRQ